MTTIAQRLAATGGRPSGFDYLRLGLSLSVIAMHSAIVCHSFPGEIALWESPLRPLVRAILPMFFALSGFLVAGSLERARTLPMFLGLRVIRIYPALAVEALLSALILGPIYTGLALTDYFHDPLFARYFWNLIGDPQYVLPGAFAHNPLPIWVNRQLWTVPYELACYGTLAAIVMLGLKRRPVLLPVAAAAIALGYGTVKFVRTGVPLHVPGPMPGVLLVVAFLAGVTLYWFRDRLPYGRGWLVGSALLTVVLLWFVPFGDLLAPFSAAYATVHLGLTDGRRIWAIRGADYSYGMFLYGFPMQQAVAATLPGGQTPLGNTVFAILVSAAFAALSWRLIEKPALRLRKPMERLESRWLEGRGKRRATAALAGRELD